MSKTENAVLVNLGFFNPGRLTDQEIEAGFIARKTLYDFILGKIVEQDGVQIPQHLLLIGQRGMGKTTLLLRIGTELRKKEHRKKFIALNYPEEQYNIDRLSKFWLNSLDALADALEKEKQIDLADELDKEIEELNKSNNKQASDSYNTFSKWTEKLNRKPVLLVDNLNLILSKISKQDHHQLRSILTKKGAPILIGASAATLKETTEYGEPFYDAFATHYLKKLSLEESIGVMEKLSEIHGIEGLEKKIRLQKGRLKTLYQLTGGTPRTIAMMMPILASGFSSDINRDLEALLDIITPLYKARFEQLSDQMQVVLDAIAMHWDPINLKELRTITELTNEKLSPQLKRLLDIGWIIKLDSSKSRGKLYEISERFFNVWYLMRRSSRRQKKAIYCLSRFLEVFYGDEIKNVASQRVSHQSKCKQDILLDYALVEAIDDQSIKQKLLRRTEKDLQWISNSDPKLIEEFGMINDEIKWNTIKRINELIQNNNRKEAKTIFSKIERDKSRAAKVNALMGYFYWELYSDYINAEKRFKRALEIDDKFSLIWVTLGTLYHFYLKDYFQSEYCYKQALEIEASDVYAWKCLGDLYQDCLKDYWNSEESYKKAAEIDKNCSDAWYGLGTLYQDCLKDYKRSEESYNRVIRIDENNLDAWNGLGNLYQYNLKDYKKSEDCYNRAIEIDENYANAWNGLGNLYQDYLKEYSRSEESYRRAIEIDGNYSFAWNGLGNLYQNYLKDYNSSEKSYRRAIEIDENYSSPWNGLGHLYQDCLIDFKLSEESYKQAIRIDDENVTAWNNLGNLYQNYLKDIKKSKESYERALEIDVSYVHAWNNLGNLYQNYLNDFKKSKESYERALEINENYLYAWQGLGDLYNDHLHDFKRSEESYLKVIELDKDNTYAWNGLGNLYQDIVKDYKKSEDAYRIAISLDSNVGLYNLIFLFLRSSRSIEEIEELLDKLEKDELIPDAYNLIKVYLAYQQDNFGKAADFLSLALNSISEGLPINTEDDWQRIAALIVSNNHAAGKHFAKTLKEQGFDIVLRPYYEAIVAMMEEDPEMYFNTVAAEVREPARKILAFMKNYIS